MPARVYLVPGFFGFTSLGSVSYFYRVEELLERALAERGVEADVIQCATQPTGSIRRRAERLLDHVLITGGPSADAIHFVGHSTGGLDVRLLLTPGVRLRDDDTEDLLGNVCRSAISVATPHYGTPLANFFTTMAGRQMLEALAVLATTSGGRYALFAAARAVRWVARVDDLVGRDRTFLDALVERLLRTVKAEGHDPIWAFLKDVASDQGAIIQLTPESMHLYNAAVTDRDDVHYASLVTAAPPPPRYYKEVDLLSVGRAALAGVFTLLHLVASREHPHYPYPESSMEALEPLRDRIDFELSPRTNDGVVPTFSQVYGEVLDLVVADHLDIVGQFPEASDEPHADWLPSGSEFGEQTFQAAWGRVADAIAAAS